MRARQGNGMALAALLLAGAATGTAAPTIAGCGVFPPDSAWNTRVDTLPVHGNSALYVAAIGTNAPLHPDFGAGDWPPGSGAPMGIPYNVVSGTQPLVSVSFYYPDESDPGPYPIPPDALVEGGTNATGDRHVLLLDRDACRLYELFDAHPASNGAWTAGSGAIFDLGSNALRPDTWTSADAAGLPILPGLVRYDEVAGGVIAHAIRFTAPATRRAYVWPARHYASTNTAVKYPPMGQRLRLRADYDISGFAPACRVILTALKQFGMILADNGSSWFISGAPDERWDNDALHQLTQVKGSAFEAVDAAALQNAPDSGAVRYPRPAIATAAAASTAVRLGVTNLFPDVGYAVEQSGDLRAGAWQTAGQFTAVDAATNWQAPLTSAPAFYRLRTRW